MKKTLKKILSWRIILAIGISIILFLSFNYFVIASFTNKQAQLREKIFATEQKIEKQLSDRKIRKLEKEKLEAEIQKQEEEKRMEAEREAEEAKREAEETEKAKKAEAEKITRNQVLAAQQNEVERQAEKQRLDAEKIAKEEAQKLANEQTKREEPQLKIEKCKAEYNASKSKMTTDLEKQLNTTKSLMIEIKKKAYEECVSKGMEQLEIDFSQVSGETFASYVSLVGDTCRGSLKENHEKAQLEFDNVKKADYDKLEQKLQKEYTECLNK